MDYFFLCEAAYYGKIETLPDVTCHRNDNSNLQSIEERLRSDGFVDDQARDPYGTIASILFWRIAAAGAVYEQLDYWERLGLAASAAETVNRRWTITGEADLLKIATGIFADFDLMSEYHGVRGRIISEWLNALDSRDFTAWNRATPVLDLFITLRYGGHEASSSERDGFKRLVETTAKVDDPALKNQAIKIMSLFY